MSPQVAGCSPTITVETGDPSIPFGFPRSGNPLTASRSNRFVAEKDSATERTISCGEPTNKQTALIKPSLPRPSFGVGVDDRPPPGGLTFANNGGLRRCAAPLENDPLKPVCRRWRRWGDRGSLNPEPRSGPCLARNDGIGDRGVRALARNIHMNEAPGAERYWRFPRDIRRHAPATKCSTSNPSRRIPRIDRLLNGGRSGSPHPSSSMTQASPNPFNLKPGS